MTFSRAPEKRRAEIMKNYLLLTKVLLKCGFGGMENRRKKGIGLSGPLSFLLVVVCLLPMISGIFSSTVSAYGILAEGGLQDLLIIRATSLSMIMTLVFGLPMILTVFYSSSDTATLLALPLAPSCIVAAKWTVSLVYEYLMVYMLAVPMLAGYGIAAHAGPLYFVLAFFVCILLPVQPLTYAGILSMLIMRIFKRIRNKQAVMMIGLIVTMVTIVPISMMSQEFANMSAQTISSQTQSIEKVNLVFPNIILANKALSSAAGNFSEGTSVSLSVPAGYGVLAAVGFFLMYAASLAAIFAVFLLLAKLIYFQSAVGMSEATQKRRLLTKDETSRFARVKSPLRTYAHVESLKVLRSPAYLLNCVLMDLIWPVFFLLPFLVGLSGEKNKPDISFFNFIFKNAGEESSLAIVLLITMIAAFFIASMNLMTATTLSREGKAFYFLKCIPMSYKDQMRAKIISSLPYTFFSTLFYLMILYIVGIAHGMTPLVLAAGILLVIPAVMIANYIQLFFELAFPKLVWENENVPVKQNFHAMAAMGVILVIGAITIGAGIVLYTLLHLPLLADTAIIAALLFAAAFLLRFLVYTYAEARMLEL